MAQYDITAPDGQKYRVTAPEDATPEQVLAYAQKSFKMAAKPDTSVAQDIKQGAGNLVAGAVRGAGSIGATILSPIDAAARAVGIQNDFIGRTDRRSAMDSGLESLGAQPDSLLYQTGKLGGEVAGTAGAGGAVANVLSKVPALASSAPAVLNAIRTGGFGPGSLAARSAGGAINGAITAGLVDPEFAGTGAVINGALPGAAKVAGKVGELAGDAMRSGSKRLMQSAIKPTIEQLRKGEAQATVDTLLKYGINPTKGGVEKLRGMVDDINQEISARIANSGATVDKQQVLSTLGGVRQKFGNQVSPTADMNAIQSVADDFISHPSLPTNDIPVQLAQDLKQGTYKVLAKKYGQLGNAETEAQKALARGLKEQISAAVPEVGNLNKVESELLTALKVSERRALMDLNKNPIGLTALANDPVSRAAFMADRSALFKSIAARMINATATASGKVGGLLGNAAPSPLLTTGGLLAIQGSQQ